MHFFRGGEGGGGGQTRCIFEDVQVANCFYCKNTNTGLK